MHGKTRQGRPNIAAAQAKTPAKNIQVLGRMAAAVVHEVRDPLHLLRLAVDELTHDIPAIREHPVKQHIEASLKRIADALFLTYQILTADAESDQSGDLVGDVRAFLSAYEKRTGTTPLVAVSGEQRAAPVRCSSALSRIMLDNLLRNALDASPSGREIQVDVSAVDHGWRVRISNQAALDRERSKPPHGTMTDVSLGLGLALTYQLAVDARGSLTVEQLGDLVVATLFLPGLRPARASLSEPMVRLPRARRLRK